MNHDTGRSCKLDEKAMSEMQTLLAECLEMERGTSKEVTGKEHLERADFILARQKQEAEQAKAEKEAAVIAKEEAEADRDVAVRETDEARTEHEKLQTGNEEKQRRIAELDSEIADKEERSREIDRDNTDSIKSGIANLFGKGKYAAIEQDNAKLKAENEQIKRSFPNAVNKEVEKRTKVLSAEKQNVEAERDRALVQNRSLAIERDKVISQLKSQQADEQQRIERAVRLANTEKDKTISLSQNRLKASRQVLNIIADMLYAASDIFKRAIDAIIHYGTEKCKSIFGNDEAADIKNVMQSYGWTKEQHQAVGSWLCDYAESRQPFNQMRHQQTYKEVADIANGAYDWKIEKGREISR